MKSLTNLGSFDFFVVRVKICPSIFDIFVSEITNKFCCLLSVRGDQKNFSKYFSKKNANKIANKVFFFFVV